MHLHANEDKSLAITSYDMDAGKSMIASNLSISLAQQGIKTVLIDGDVRRGVLHNSFLRNKSPGLADYLLHSGENTLSVQDIIQETHVDGLSLIPSGKNVTNPTELLASKKFRECKSTLSKQFDMIILDTPPIGLAADAVAVHDIFKRYILVVLAGKTNVVDLMKRVHEYKVLKDKVMGLVLNKAMVTRKHSYYRNSSYYYTLVDTTEPD
jgi:capsular exopolysaccharide synthesis family protein